MYTYSFFQLFIYLLLLKLSYAWNEEALEFCRKQIKLSIKVKLSCDKTNKNCVCFKYFGEEKNFDDAQNQCKNQFHRNSNLPIIYDEQRQKELQKVLEENRLEKTWIGMRRGKSTHETRCTYKFLSPKLEIIPNWCDNSKLKNFGHRNVYDEHSLQWLDGSHVDTSMKDSQGEDRWKKVSTIDKLLAGQWWKDHPHRGKDKHDCATLEKQNGVYRWYTGLCKGLQDEKERKFKFVCELKIDKTTSRDTIQNEMRRRNEREEKEKQKKRELDRLQMLIKSMECNDKHHQKTKGCTGNFKGKCKCQTNILNFSKVEKQEAVKICNKENGKLVELKLSKVCEKEIPDKFSHLDIHTLRQCKNNKIQMYFNCTGQGRECLCMTAILQLPNKEEAQIYCNNINGRIVPRNSPNKNDTNFVNHLIKEESIEKWDDSFICETKIKDDNLDRVDFENLKLCQNKRFQKPHKCIASPSKKCKCITFFQQPLEHNNALQICQKMEGTLPNSIFKEELELILDYWRTQNENTVVKNQQIMFEDKSAMIERSNGKKPHVNILTSSPKKGSFMCMSDINDEYSRIDWDEMKKCSNKKIQKSYQCIANPQENCKCMTFFQQHLEKNEAIEQCKNMGGNLVDSSFKDELEESYLNHWKSKSGEKFKKNTRIMFKDNKSGIIDWSEEINPLVNITDESPEKESFICESDIKDDYSHIDLTDLNKCSNEKIQKSYQCIANPQENCKCMTFFQQHLEKNEAIEQCENMGGNLVDSSFKDELEESFLNYWKSNSADTFKKNTDLIFGDDQYAEIDWSNNKQPQVIIKVRTMKQKGHLYVLQK